MARLDVGLDSFFSSKEGGVYDALPEGVRITFDLDGPGGGIWTIARDDNGDVTVIRAAVKRPDCRLGCSVEDFEALVTGNLNVRQAFLEERIDVVGDVGLIWRLQKVLVARRLA